MSDFIKAAGGVFSKVESKRVVREPTAEELKKQKDIDELNAKQQRQAATMYAEFVTHDVLQRVLQFHDFSDPVWGGRHFARLLNTCASILDLESAHLELRHTKDDPYKKNLEICFWMCLFIGRFVKGYRWSEQEYQQAMVDVGVCVLSAGRLSEDDLIVVIDGITKWNEIKSEHMAINAFHDAMHLESAFFGEKVIPEILRTYLAKTIAYRTYVARQSNLNKSPLWLKLWQEIVGVEGFYFLENASMNQAGDGF